MPPPGLWATGGKHLQPLGLRDIAATCGGNGSCGNGDRKCMSPQLVQQPCRLLPPELRAVGGSSRSISNYSSYNIDIAATTATARQDQLCSTPSRSRCNQSSRGEAFCNREHSNTWSPHLQLWRQRASPRQRLEEAAASRSHLRREWRLGEKVTVGGGHHS